MKQGANGHLLAKICWKAGFSEASYFNSRKKYDGLLPDETRRLKQLEEENAELKKLVADLRHVRPKLSCRVCETIVQASMPSLSLERGKPGPGLLANVLVSKYTDHLPLCRQSEIYTKASISSAPPWRTGWAALLLFSTLWSRRCAAMSCPDVLHGDDTPVPVLAAGLGKTRTGRLWTYVRDGGPHGSSQPPAAVFLYSPDRKGEHPQKHLRTFTGVLHADGYAGFNVVFETGMVTAAACWAHIQRKFFDEHASKSSATTTEALDRIGALYRVEDTIRGKPPDEHRRVRQDEARPLQLI